MLSLGRGPTVRMTKGPGKRRTTTPSNFQHLRRGRALGRRLAPLALSMNSYAILKRYADEVDESMDDERKDTIIGAMTAAGAILNASYGLVSVPLGWKPPPRTTTPAASVSKSDNAEPTATANEAVPLLLNQDESTAMDLELGASAGATPSATVSPPVPAPAQKKATYKKKGFNVRRKVKSTAVKTTAPATIITSTPTVPTSTHKSTAALSGKAARPDFHGFKIPLKRRRLPSEAESSDSSDGCESTVLSVPEVPTTSRPWVRADQEAKSASGGDKAQTKSLHKGLLRRKHRGYMTSTLVKPPDPGPTSATFAARDPASVESLEPPHNFESMAKMMLQWEIAMEQKDPPRHSSRETHEFEERRERYEEHSRSRGWRSRDEYRHPEELPRARWDRGRRHWR